MGFKFRQTNQVGPGSLDQFEQRIPLAFNRQARAHNEYWPTGRAHDSWHSRKRALLHD